MRNGTLTVYVNDPRAAIISAWARTLLDSQSPEELPDIASEALVQGVETPSLAELAGMGRSDPPAELHELFGEVIKELGISLDIVAARIWLLYMWCDAVLRGKLAAFDASWAIFTTVYLEIGSITAARPDFPTGLVDELIGLFVASDSDFPDTSEYQTKFEAAARTVVQTYPGFG